MKKTELYNKGIWSEYASRGAAFLMLASEMPGLMKDIDPKKSNEISMYAFQTRKVFNDMRDKSMVPWCIAAVPTETWAKELFPDSTSPVDELWDKIFTICNIKEKDPVAVWNKKIELLQKRSEKLNNYKFQKLIYKNTKGTDFEIELPENHIWCSGAEKLKNGKTVLVNFPTEEVFTSPLKNSANGIVYSSKPLAYQGVIIDDFSMGYEIDRYWFVDCVWYLCLGVKDFVSPKEYNDCILFIQKQLLKKFDIKESKKDKLCRKSCIKYLAKFN